MELTLERVPAKRRDIQELRGLDEALEKAFPGSHLEWLFTQEEKDRFLGGVCAQMIRSVMVDLRSYRESTSKEAAADLFGKAVDQDAVRRLYDALAWVFGVMPAVVPFSTACELAEFGEGDEGSPTNAEVTRRVLARVLKKEICEMYRHLAVLNPELRASALDILGNYIDASSLTASLH